MGKIGHPSFRPHFGVHLTSSVPTLHLHVVHCIDSWKVRKSDVDQPMRRIM